MGQQRIRFRVIHATNQRIPRLSYFAPLNKSVLSCVRRMSDYKYVPCTVSRVYGTSYVVRITPLWADCYGRYPHSSWNSSVGAKKDGVGNVSPRTFRRRVVRYVNWHPLGCRAIELGKKKRTRTRRGCDTHRCRTR